jgi:acetyl esterase/lipase
LSLRAGLLRFYLRRFVKNRPELSVEEARAQLRAFERWIPRRPADVTAVAVDAGGVAGEQIATPISADDRHVLYLHGGGFVAGSPSLYRDLTWRIASRARARVLCIDYRLAPEHPYPAALDDAVTAYRWMLAQGVSPKRLGVMGDSAGGGLALALLLRLRDEGITLPAAAVALSPWTDMTLTAPSYRLNAESEVMLKPNDAPRLAAWYLAGADPYTPHASPLYGDPSGLPPTLIQVGSEEILRDDAVRMADHMRAAGCDVQLEVWPRMPHVWPFFARILPEGREALARIGVFLRTRLG